MITVEQIAVEFVTAGEVELRRGLESVVVGANSTAAAINKIPAAADKVPPALNRAGESAHGLGRRLEHLSVMAAFAFTAMANDSEKGLTRLAHGIAFLGFAFGPVAGAITTFVAIAGEQFLNFLHKSAEAATKAEEANRKLIDSYGESKNLAGAARRQQELFSGAEYTTEADPLTRAGIKAGGILGLAQKIPEVQKKIDDLAKASKDAEGSAADAIQTQWEAAKKELAELFVVQQAVSKEWAEMKRLTDQLTKEAVKKEQADSQQKKSEAQLRADHALYLSEAKNNYDKLLAIADWWVGEMGQRYGELSPEYTDALREQQQIQNEAAANQVAEQRKVMEYLTHWRESNYQLEETKAAGHYGKLLELAHQHVEDLKALHLEGTAEYQAALVNEAHAQEQYDKKVHDETVRMAHDATVQITDLVQGLFSGGGEKLSFGNAVLSALGDMFMQMGEAMIAASPILKGLAAAFVDPLTAGEASFAYGAALVALGATLGSIATRHHGSGGGGSGGGGASFGSGYTTVVTGAYNQPSATANITARNLAPPTPIHVTIIGKDDPKVQREFLELAARASRRGSTSG